MSERDEWLAWRKSGIGASDVAAALGLSPWRTPWSLWAEKTGRTDHDDETEAMEFGRRAEPMIGPWFTDRTGLYVAGEQTWCSHPEHDYRRCTVDGFVGEFTAEQYAISDPLGWFEAKTTSEPPARWEEQIPDHYACQAAWISHVTGIESGWFAVIHLAFGRPQFRVYEHTPSLDDVAYVVEHVDRFWREHVLADISPAVDWRPPTTAAIKSAYPDGEGVLEADEHLAAVVDELARCKDIAKATQTRIDSMENEIRVALADKADTLTCGLKDGGEPNVIASWKAQNRTGIDTKAVRAEFGDRFDTTTSSRVLRLHNTKRIKEHTP